MVKILLLSVPILLSVSSIKSLSPIHTFCEPSFNFAKLALYENQLWQIVQCCWIGTIFWMIGIFLAFVKYCESNAVQILCLHELDYSRIGCVCKTTKRHFMHLIDIDCIMCNCVFLQSNNYGAIETTKITVGVIMYNKMEL
jgi:hypothetical protein